MRSKIILSVVIVMNLSFNATAQTLDEAGAIFNQAIEYGKQGNYAEAVKAYEQTIKICTQVGDEAMELQIMAEQQLPGTYFNLGKSLYEAKNFNEAITNFEKSVEYADQMGEAKTGDNSRTYLAGIYTSLGNSDLKNDALDNAIEKYNKALLNKPAYYKAFYGLGLVYKKQDNLPLMKEALDQSIALAGSDEKSIGNAIDAASSAFRNAGAIALQSNKYSVAVENLLSSQEYAENDPLTFYYLAIAYNGLSKWDEAISAANSALETQPLDKSDIYFELGKSSENKGDNAAACEAYKNVKAGNNVAAAKYQMETVLKCQ